MSIPTLPSGVSVLETQVAGHTFYDSSTGIGMLKDGGAMVYKSQTKKDCAEREKQFYECLQTDASLCDLKLLVPKYYGTRMLDIRGKDLEFLRLQDLTWGMQEPCILDCKIGKRTWDPLATEEKRLAESSKYLHCREAFGFCIPGFQVYSLNASKTKRYGREYGKGLDENSTYEAFKIFLNADTQLFRPLVSRILCGLKDIQQWARTQRRFNIYSSSVLITYDAKKLKELIEMQKIRSASGVKLDTFVMCTENSVSSSEWIHVKMIDFAHIFANEDNVPDTNYIEGIDHLVGIFEELVRDAI